MLNKLHNWLISKVVGNKPVIANVELSLHDPIQINSTAVVKNVKAL